MSKTAEMQIATAVLSLILFALLPRPANADLTSEMQAKARSIVNAEAAAVAQTPALAVVIFSLTKMPTILESLPEDDRERCEEEEGADAEVEVACQVVFRQIIEDVKAFLAASYSMTQSLGQFDPTTVAYSRETALLFLDLE